MGVRPQLIVFWPGMTYDIERCQQSCFDCVKNASTQPPLRTVPSTPPATPFEQIYADFFDCVGQHYLIVGDRLSGWPDVYRSPNGSPQAESEGLIHFLRNFFSRFGMSEEMSSDGSPEFISTTTKNFLSRCGVPHRPSSAHHLDSNGRAEVAVKSTKRILPLNTDSTKILDTDRFMRAIIQLRNTPDPDCNVLPGEIVFYQPIRNAFTFINCLKNPATNMCIQFGAVHGSKKEKVLCQQFHDTAEARNRQAKPLPNLYVDDQCCILN